MMCEEHVCIVYMCIVHMYSDAISMNSSFMSNLFTEKVYMFWKTGLNHLFKFTSLSQWSGCPLEWKAINENWVSFELPTSSEYWHFRKNIRSYLGYFYGTSASFFMLDSPSTPNSWVRFPINVWTNNNVYLECNLSHFG